VNVPFGQAHEVYMLNALESEQTLRGLDSTDHANSRFLIKSFIRNDLQVNSGAKKKPCNPVPAYKLIM
jgi:hypothetical protein